MQDIEDIEYLRDIAFDDLLKSEGGSVISDNFTSEDFEALKVDFVRLMGPGPLGVKKLEEQIATWREVTEVFI